MSAQEVRLSDSDTGYPVQQALIREVDSDVFLTSDLNGTFQLGVFSPDARLVISHPFYEMRQIAIETLGKQGFVLYMNPRTEQLGEVVLSVARRRQPLRELVRNVEVADQKVIALSNASTSADLLSNSMNIYVQKSQLGGGSPMIRGFAANRLLIAVDGIRMNNAIFRGGNLQNVISVDPLVLKSAEVITGAGSVVYGSDALGGVMNFYFREAPLSKEDPELHTEAFVRYATASEEKTAQALLSYGRKKWGYLGSVSYSDFGNLRMGRNGPEEYLRTFYVRPGSVEDELVENNDPLVQRPSGYSQWNTLHTITYDPGAYWRWKGTFYYSTTSDFPRYDRLLRTQNGVPRSAEWYYGPQRWLQTSLKGTHTYNYAWFNKLQFALGYQFFEESRNDRGFNDDFLFSGAEKVDAITWNMDFEKLWSVRHRIHYGIEWVWNKVRSEASVQNITNGSEAPNASRYPDGSTWYSGGVYVNYQYKPVTNWLFQGGIRYTVTGLEGDLTPNNTFYNFPFRDLSIHNSALTGSFGFNWRVNRHLRWKGSFSSAFRAPNLDDAGKIFDSEPGSVVVPNPDLNPEYAYTYELGLELYPAERWRLGFQFFYTRLTDALVRRDFSFDGRETLDYNGEESTVQAIQNAAFARITGLEVSLEGRLSHRFRTKASWNMAKGVEELDDGSVAPARHVPPFFGDIHLYWESEEITLDLFGQMNAEIGASGLAPSEVAKDYIYAVSEDGRPFSPSWYTLNLRGTWKLNDSWQVNIALENITDQRYRTYSSGIVAPGRNLVCSLRFRT